MKEIIEDILGKYQFIFKPSYWDMNLKYNEKLDKFVLREVSKGNVTPIDNYCCEIGGVYFWIANRPYLSVIPCRKELIGTTIMKEYGRPSRMTIQRTLRFIDSFPKSEQSQSDFEKELRKLTKNNRKLAF